MTSLPQPSRKLLLSVLAGAVSLSLIAGAYFLSDANFKLPTAEATSTEELLKEYATKDTDSDGLPDWQEALYKTDPRNAYSVSDERTDGEAVKAGDIKPVFETSTPEAPVIPGTPATPNSVTDIFARTFFEQFITTSGGDTLTEAQKSSLLASLMADFGEIAAQSLVSSYTEDDIIVDTTVSLDAYVAAIDQIFGFSNSTVDEVGILEDVDRIVNSGDTKAVTRLKSLSVTFKDIAKKLLETPVPPSLKDSHLKLVRANDTLSNLCDAYAHFETDPLLVVGALRIHLASVGDSVAGLIEIGTAILTHDDEPSEAGSALIQFLKKNNVL